MVMKVVWTEPAQARLREITDYLRREAGAKTARKIRDRIIARPRILAANPHAGQCEESLADMGEEFRYLVEGNYKILYWVEPECIFISTVFDCRRDPARLRDEVPK